jgi:hypothetical protein
VWCVINDEWLGAKFGKSGILIGGDLSRGGSVGRINQNFRLSIFGNIGIKGLINL